MSVNLTVQTVDTNYVVGMQICGGASVQNYGVPLLSIARKVSVQKSVAFAECLGITFWRSAGMGAWTPRQSGFAVKESYDFFACEILRENVVFHVESMTRPFLEQSIA